MGNRKKFFLAEKKMQKTLDALGKTTGGMERFCPIGADLYVATDFIRIGSYVWGSEIFGTQKLGLTQEKV